MKRKLWIAAAGALAVLATAVAAAFAVDKKPVAMPPAERVVKLYKISDGRADLEIIYPGKVQPSRHAELFFRVSGPVIQQELKYGQTVEAGTVLMRIDPRDYQREVDRLKHQLEAQQVEAEYTGTEYRRAKKLLETNASSQATYDAAVTKKNAAEAQVRMLETSLAIARDRLEDTILKAPFRGTVVETRIEQYEIAQAHVPVVVLEDLRSLEINVSIPGGNLPVVNLKDGLSKYIGLTFDVTFPGRGPRRYKAAISEFKASADAGSETYELTLLMEAPEDSVILPGMSAEVHGLPYREDVCPTELKVPFAAVFNRRGGAAVWVYDARTKTLNLLPVRVKRPVEGDFLAVEGELTPGMLIVAAGGDWLEKDTPVRVMNPEVLQ